MRPTIRDASGPSFDLAHRFVPAGLTATAVGAAGCATFALRDGDRFIWRSSDTTVARVDSLGLVSAAGIGEATIRATAARDFSVSGASQVLVR